MDPFATVEDLEAGFRELSLAEKDRAETLLIRASAQIIREFQIAGKEIDMSDEVLMINLVTTCCDMVRRVLGMPREGDFTSFMQTAGSYSEQITMSNPSGDLYLSESERRKLGIPKRRSVIGCIRPVIGGLEC